jgi:hypothetical protein
MCVEYARAAAQELYSFLGGGDPLLGAEDGHPVHGHSSLGLPAVMPPTEVRPLGN